MNYGEALDWLHGTQLFGIKLGLENIRHLAREVGVERPARKIIHVAGTNGKGSVCAMAESIARSAGYRTGLYTSPHLVRFNERIQINGQPIDDERIAVGLSRIREIVADWNPHPTFFELATALALQIFQEEQIDLLILETGMGGRLDSTNFLTPDVSVITRIDLDHAQYLGPTLADIAREKAGIIKPQTPVITLPQAPEVMTVLREAAEKLQAPLTVLEKPLAPLEIGLAGSHQLWNAALAVHAIKVTEPEISQLAIQQGLAKVSLPGRFQQFPNRLVLDGAHNPAAALRLVQTWQEVFGLVKPLIVLGILADKEADEVIRALLPLAAEWVTVPVRSPRTLPAADLAALLRENGAQNISTAGNVAEALHNQSGPTLLTGSLFLVGEALAYLEKTTQPRSTHQ